MAQIFPRSANALARASVFVALFLAAAGGYALALTPGATLDAISEFANAVLHVDNGSQGRAA